MKHGPHTHAALWSDAMEVREIRPDEFEPAGAIVVAAYRNLPGGHLSEGYAAELADVRRRAVEAEVLVAVDGENSQLFGCVTYVPDARCVELKSRSGRGLGKVSTVGLDMLGKV